VGFIIGILNSLMVVGSLFMICIILIQRGKGGGLAGAFGGVGGSSAFGTKAGDVFTKITIGIAAGWIVVSMLLVVLTNRRTESAWGSDSTSLTKELSPSSTKPKAKSLATDTGGLPAELPPPIPTPAPGSSQPAPPVNIPAIPEMPPTPPSNPAPAPK
jgi:preprotein translocase subunit SecG